MLVTLLGFAEADKEMAPKINERADFLLLEMKVSLCTDDVNFRRMAGTTCLLACQNMTCVRNVLIASRQIQSNALLKRSNGNSFIQNSSQKSKNDCFGGNGRDILNILITLSYFSYWVAVLKKKNMYNSFQRLNLNTCRK